MSKLHSMLAAVRDRVHGAGHSIAQGFDEAAAVTVSFAAGEWQALMRELESVTGSAPAPAPTEALAPAPLPQVADALAANPSQAPADAGHANEAPLV